MSNKLRGAIGSLGEEYKTAALIELERLASYDNARDAMRTGKNVHSTAAFLGKSEEELLGDGRYAVQTAAGAAVQRVENVQVVAQRYGIMNLSKPASALGLRPADFE